MSRDLAERRSMLANLLPGLRELRTPLAIGWIWLIALWIASGRILPSSEDTGIELLRQAFSTAALLGQATVIGALSFVAYLLGSLLEKENTEENYLRRFMRLLVP